MTRQTVARKSSAKQAAQARRLLAAAQPAKYVMNATIQVDRLAGRDVVFCRAHQDLQIGTLHVAKGESYYLLSSKMGVNRFYAFRQDDNGIYCSTTDSAVVAMCLTRVRVYRMKMFGKVVA